VLLYDAECRLCRFTARCVARLDRRQELALLPLQDAAASTLLAALDEDERLDTWRMVRPDGSLTGYGAGIPDLLQAMRLTRSVGRLLGRAPAGALEFVYGAVARNRRTLGRLVADGAAPRRHP
jgi:predicted DCC family thiol-disulfide oxidoreductase YuxK